MIESGGKGGNILACLNAPNSRYFGFGGEGIEMPAGYEIKSRILFELAIDLSSSFEPEINLSKLTFGKILFNISSILSFENVKKALLIPISFFINVFNFNALPIAENNLKTPAFSNSGNGGIDNNNSFKGIKNVCIPVSGTTKIIIKKIIYKIKKIIIIPNKGYVVIELAAPKNLNPKKFNLSGARQWETNFLSIKRVFQTGSTVFRI